MFPPRRFSGNASSCALCAALMLALLASLALAAHEEQDATDDISAAERADSTAGRDDPLRLRRHQSNVKYDDDQIDLNHADQFPEVPHGNGLGAGIDDDDDDDEEEDNDNGDSFQIFNHLKRTSGRHKFDLDGGDLKDSDSVKQSLANLGLTEEELKDLDEIELLGNGTAKDEEDLRPKDAAPPPQMPINPHEMDNIQMRKTNAGGLEALDDDTQTSGNTSDTSSTSSNLRELRLKRENAQHRERIAELAEHLTAARSKAKTAEQKALDSEHEVVALRTQIEHSKTAFQRSLESMREEKMAEKEDMAATIEEQKRAFEELLEEKTLLSQMLSDEQKVLKGLQEKIQHPDLGLWMRQRAAKAAILLVETREADKVKYYANKYMAPKVKKMRHRLETLERRVERTVDHLLPAKYGSFVALLLSVGLVGFPLVVTMSTVVSLSKTVSLRQYVLLGNVFLTAFVAGLCVAGLLLRQDPLQTIYEASETVFITLQLTAAIAFPIFLALIGCTVVRSHDRLDTMVFGCEFVFYGLVAMNYRSRVWRPAMLGEHIETGIMMYAIYLVDFISMTALTISSARIDTAGAGVVVDAENGEERKDVRSNGTASLPSSITSTVSEWRNGLVQAATGQGNRTGKQE